MCCRFDSAGAANDKASQRPRLWSSSFLRGSKIVCLLGKTGQTSLPVCPVWSVRCKSMAGPPSLDILDTVAQVVLCCHWRSIAYVLPLWMRSKGAPRAFMSDMNVAGGFSGGMGVIPASAALRLHVTPLYLRQGTHSHSHPSETTRLKLLGAFNPQISRLSLSNWHCLCELQALFDLCREKATSALMILSSFDQGSNSPGSRFAPRPALIAPAPVFLNAPSHLQVEDFLAVLTPHASMPSRSEDVRTVLEITDSVDRRTS